MKTLKEIFAETGWFGEDRGVNDKGSTHTYIETYDRLFVPFQKGCRFMEIGLALGDSLRMFDGYFEDSILVGVDLSIVFQPWKYKNKIQLFADDATTSDFEHRIKDYTFDIIIDDGSHADVDQAASFNLLKSKMAKGSLYIIEDILNLELSRELLESLHDNCEIIDMRDTGRYDNILVIYRF